MNDTADSRVSVVLLCSASEVAGRLAEKWGGTGLSLAAVALSGTRRNKPLPKAFAGLVRSGVPVAQVHHPVDWDELAGKLRGMEADILLCYGFMRLVPDSFLRRFPLGGVNFHPALLPFYSGPHPTRCLVADGAYGRCGGLTLHVMTAAFDEGDILAQAPFEPGDYRSFDAYTDVLVSTMVAMVRDALPLYRAGRLRLLPQEAAGGAWASYHPRSMIISADWSADDIAAAGAFLDRRKGNSLRLGDGRRVRIAGLRRRLGPPAGKAPRIRIAAVEFDCRDARVSVFRANRIGRFAQRLWEMFFGKGESAGARPIGFDVRDGA